MYYYSRSLQGAEARYPQIEKLALVVITITKRLKSYFKYIQLLSQTEYPLLQLLYKPDVSKRLTK